MKTSRACTGMLSSENADFKFYQKCEKHTNHVHHRSRARGAILSVQISPSLTRNMNVKVAIELYNMFSKIWKFRHW